MISCDLAGVHFDTEWQESEWQNGTMVQRRYCTRCNRVEFRQVKVLALPSE